MSLAVSTYFNIHPDSIKSFSLEGRCVNRFSYVKDVTDRSVRLVKGIGLAILYTLGLFIGFMVTQTRQKMLNCFAKTEVVTRSLTKDEALKAHKEGLLQVVDQLPSKEACLVFINRYTTHALKNYSIFARSNVVKMLNWVMQLSPEALPLQELKALVKAMVTKECSMRYTEPVSKPCSEKTFAQEKGRNGEDEVICFFAGGSRFFKAFSSGNLNKNHPALIEGRVEVITFPKMRAPMVRVSEDKLKKLSQSAETYLDKPVLVAMKVQAKNIEFSRNQGGSGQTHIHFDKRREVTISEVREYRHLKNGLKQLSLGRNLSTLKDAYPEASSAFEMLQAAYSQLTAPTAAVGPRDESAEIRQWMKDQIQQGVT
ncbi:MAG: hypothetical protein MRY21_02225 [Simkaniaceae bacterium]|nr:hypothetical protein [Simkaniaceae bacterium]